MSIQFQAKVEPPGLASAVGERKTGSLSFYFGQVPTNLPTKIGKLPKLSIRVMRVLTRANVGGPVQHVRLLECELPALGVESTLLLGRVASDEGDATEVLRAAGVGFREVPGLGRPVRPIADARALAWLRRTFLRERPDVVHTHTGKAGLLGRVAARLAGVPAVVHTHHGHLFHGYYGPLGSRAMLALERSLARRTDVLFVPGEPLRRELLDLGFAPRDGIVAYPPAVPLDGFPAAAGARSAVRASLGAADADVVVGTLGRLVPVKGVDRLVRAAAAGGWRLAVAGAGPERERLEALARSLGARASFAGETRDPASFLAALDVFALGSRNEGAPAALLEAMASGLPCVAPRVGSIPQAIEDEASGLLFDADDDRALAAAIGRLARDGELRARLGGAASARARRTIDPSAMASAIAEGYRRALEGRAGAKR
jgi:glycosyltransferase involved in cell wall biosynthesis